MLLCNLNHPPGVSLEVCTLWSLQLLLLSVVV